MKQPFTDKKTSENTTKVLDDYQTVWGKHWSYGFRSDPKRLGFVLSRYKFSMKMAKGNNAESILELGSSEGIGASILGENIEKYVGVDFDKGAIDAANKNFPQKKYRFIYDDFMKKQYGEFDAIVSLDVIEHIHKEFESTFFETIVMNLSEKGMCIIGTPNITSEKYASIGSKIGHVNLYSSERLQKAMEKYFYKVLPFGMNDELMHTGYANMCHYIFCVGLYKKG